MDGDEWPTVPLTSLQHLSPAPGAILAPTVLPPRVYQAHTAYDLLRCPSAFTALEQVDFMIMGVAAGALLVYGCFLGEILSTLSDGHAASCFYTPRGRLLKACVWHDVCGVFCRSGLLSRSISILAISLCLAPLTLMPDLSALAPAAYVGVAAIIYSMVNCGYPRLPGSPETALTSPNELSLWLVLRSS